MVNEELIRTIVRLKLDLLHSVLDRLPAEEAEKLKRIGMAIYQEVGTYYDAQAPCNRRESSSEIKEIVIE